MQQFRRHVTLRPGGNLQQIGIVTVGQAEVYQLHILSIVGDEDVLRLQVAMHNLLAVHVLQRTTQLTHQFARQGPCQFPAVHQLAQGDAVDILQDNAMPQSVHILPTQSAAYVRMVKLIADGKFLLQHLLIESNSGTAGLQSLQQMELSIGRKGKKIAITVSRSIKRRTDSERLLITQSVLLHEPGAVPHVAICRGPVACLVLIHTFYTFLSRFVRGDTPMPANIPPF